jgi:hypothetical protein
MGSLMCPKFELLESNCHNRTSVEQTIASNQKELELKMYDLCHFLKRWKRSS